MEYLATHIEKAPGSQSLPEASNVTAEYEPIISQADDSSDAMLTRRVNLAEASQFLQTLGNLTAFRTFHDSDKTNRDLCKKISGAFDKVTGRLAKANSLGAGVFVVINSGGQTDNEITKINAVFADFDGTAIPDSFELPPSMVVQSSAPDKVHLYWLVEGDFPLAEFKPVQQAIANKYGSDLSVCNLSRVMRVPGFYHQKGEPKQTKLLSCNPTVRYTYDQLSSAFPTKTVSPVNNLRGLPAGHTREGGRNTFLASEAGSMRRSGMDEGQIYDALQQINLERCQPPLDDSEVAGIARSIAKYPDGLDEITEGTELALANHLKTITAGSVRYLVERGCFVTWDGKRWRLDSDGSLFMGGYEEIIQGIAASALSEGQHSRRVSGLKLVLKLQQRKTIDNVTALFKRLPGVPIGLEEFDSDPYLFQVANGVINLKTGEFRPVKLDDFCLRHSPVEHDPTATCPEFVKMLLWAMRGDQSRCDFLRRLAGYFMVGHAQEEVLPIFQGCGANGKSTVREAFRRVLGTYASIAQPGLLVNRDASSQSNDIARLAGTRAVFVSETDENDRLAESTVKYITQQEPISARFLHKEFFTFTPRFKCLLATNHKPIVRGSDSGIWRRLVLIPFENSLSEDQRDVHFVERVLVPELPGILNWMVAGAIDYNNGGLMIPLSIKAATDEYREKSDVYGEFFADRLSVSAAEMVSAAGIWAAFTFWHKLAFATDPPPWLSARGLGRWLSDRGYKSCRGSGGERSYRGLKLQTA